MPQLTTRLAAAMVAASLLWTATLAVPAARASGAPGALLTAIA